MTGVAPLRLLLLALLPAVGVAVWWDGQHYDAGLLNFKQHGKVAGDPLPLPERLLDLSRLVGGVRHYDKSNLHDYVNGHAEYFFGAGFVSLAVGDYGNQQGAPLLTVDVFHMGTPLQAFGTLMDESAGRAAPLSQGGFGYGDQRGMLFMQGPYFIKMSSFAAGLSLQQGVTQLQGILGNSPAGAMTFSFPQLGKPGTIRYIKENYRGLEFLNGVVEQTFLWEKEAIKVFRLDGNKSELTVMAETIKVFFKDSGAAIVVEERQGVVFTRIEDPYEGKWYYFLDGQGMVGIFSPWREEWVNILLDYVKNHGRGQKTIP